jgi:hypothetical protein
MQSAADFDLASAWGGRGVHEERPGFRIVDSLIERKDGKLKMTTVGHDLVLESAIETATLQWLAAVSSWPKDRDLVVTSNESVLHQHWYDRVGEYLVARLLSGRVINSQRPVSAAIFDKIVPHGDDFVSRILTPS